MNIGDIKAFLGQESQNARADSLRPDEARRQQLQESGLRQAANLQQSFQASLTTSSISVFSSQRAIGVKVYNGSLNQNLVMNEQHYNGRVKEDNSSKKGLFDFEEVAKNVLNFVGGVIKSAAAGGADEAKLMDLFGQARSGVLKGIDMAKSDLSGLMNDEISNGIASSHKLIESGIQRLEDKIFGREPEVQEGLSEVQYEQQTSYLRSDSGALNIRTRDGDEVTIRFEDLDKFELNRSLLLSSSNVAEQTDKSGQPAHSNQVKAAQLPEAEVEEEQNQSQQKAQEKLPADADEQSKSPAPSKVMAENQESYLFFEKNDFSFSLQGELDEGEIRAIGKLVNNANDLADEFFNGDVEQAFKQALEMGFDEEELTGFALQLNKVEQVQEVQAYEQVSKYSEDEDVVHQRELAVKPVAEYLEKMLEMFEQSRNTLESGSQYEELIQGLINQNTGLKVPELLDAINRFHAFNNKLLNNMPEGAS